METPSNLVPRLAASRLAALRLGVVPLWAAVLAAVLMVGACATAPEVRFSAVYLDMDGTALGTDHQVRPATVEALRRYQACGGRVGIATGRTLEQVEPFLDDVAPSLPLVLYNGGLSVDPKTREIVAVRHLPSDVVVRVLEVGAGNADVQGIVVHGATESWIDRSTEELDRELAAGLIRPTGVLAKGALAGTPDLRPGEQPADVKDPPRTETPGPAVKVMLLTYAGKVDAVARQVGDAVGTDARSLVTSPRTVEVVPNGVNKAVGILAALSQAGIDPAQVLVFGDSGNDVEMLSVVGIGIAMGNCRPEACDAAMLRIGNNGTDAIAQVIERLALTPSCPRPRPSSLPAPASEEAPRTE